LLDAAWAWRARVSREASADRWASFSSGVCRFVVTTDEGKPQIRLELFHDTVSSLRSTKIEFEVLSGTSTDQARAFVGAMNEMILGVIVTPKG
jgi:hypothetical protein